MSVAMSLDNKVAVITGAAGGLGRAFARAFAEAGASVVCADINLAGAEESVRLIREAGGQALAVQVNVTDEDSTARMALAAVEKFSNLDILINNAAIYATLERKPFWEIDVAAWEQVMAVNLKGAWLCAKAAFPYMRERGGRIIHISSATFFSGSPHWVHYVASKGGIIGMTRSMAREAGQFGITVNAIAPGFTLTDASLSLMDNAEEYGLKGRAIPRGAQAEDIIGAALYLASPASDFVTGQTIVVDGGSRFN